jgi:hypothetical protein
VPPSFSSFKDLVYYSYSNNKVFPKFRHGTPETSERSAQSAVAIGDRKSTQNGRRKKASGGSRGSNRVMGSGNTDKKADPGELGNGSSGEHESSSLSLAPVCTPSEAGHAMSLQTDEKTAVSTSTDTVDGEVSSVFSLTKAGAQSVEPVKRRQRYPARGRTAPSKHRASETPTKQARDVGGA